MNLNIIRGIEKAYKIYQNDCFWNMLIMMEDNIKTLHESDIKNNHGVYIFFDWDDNPLRIGKAVKLRNRILSYSREAHCFNIFNEFQDKIAYVSVIYTSGKKESLNVEYDLIQYHKPKFNIHSKYE